jgi:hypothetical protein
LGKEEAMNLLESNARRVRRLSPMGIWLFIVGRVLAAFGLGILVMAYFPRVAFPAALPLIGAGLVLLVIALRSLVRGEDVPPR